MMKNQMKKIAGVVTGIALATVPFLASAQAFGTSTVVATSQTFFSEIALLIGGVIVSILSLLAALTGLGWAVRKYRHYIAGRKF